MNPYYKLLAVCQTMRITRLRDKWSTYEQCKADGEGHWCPQATLDPLLEILHKPAKKDGDMNLSPDGVVNLQVRRGGVSL